MRMDMRDLINLIETRLPLQSGVNGVARGSYAASMCVMRPEDFIHLTTHDQAEYDRIFSDDFSSLDDFKNNAATEYRKSNYNAPFLGVEYGSGLVVKHEGRHRAAMIAKAGGDKFPAYIQLESKLQYVLKYRKCYTDETTPDEMIEEILSSRSEVSARQAELEMVDKPDFWFSAFRDTIEGGMPLRGAPDRSQPDKWKHAAWTNDDFPHVLVGQFNQSIKIPTSTMKYGPVKGYTHHR